MSWAFVFVFSENIFYGVWEKNFDRIDRFKIPYKYRIYSNELNKISRSFDDRFAFSFSISILVSKSRSYEWICWKSSDEIEYQMHTKKNSLNRTAKKNTIRHLFVFSMWEQSYI